MSEKLERVKYRKSALREVIFQVKFPSILRIDTEAPAEFQEMVRQKYPMYNDRRNETIVKINGQDRAVSKSHNHEFIAADGRSKVNLTNSFVAISTLDYDRWEVFTKQCFDIIEYLMQVYKPAVVQRIGLRYKDLITRSRWGMMETPWNELIKAEVLGIVGELPENEINRFVVDFEIQGSDKIVEHRHFELVHDSESPNPVEKSFLIDCDYYCQGIINNNDIKKFAEELHEHSSSFIRSVITNKLDAIMEPVKL